MIDWKCFFDQPIRNYMKTYNNIQKIATGQKDDNTTGCLLIYNYFKKPYYDSKRLKLTTSTWCRS